MASGFLQIDVRESNQLSLGEHPGGYVGFTGTRIWVMLVDKTRKAPLAVLPSDAEAISLMRTRIAYTSKYDSDARWN
jgi:hypothetical protein